MSFDKFVLDCFRCDFVEFCSGIWRVIVAIFGLIFFYCCHFWSNLEYVVWVMMNAMQSLPDLLHVAVD